MENSKYKVGMYLRCPIDQRNEQDFENPRMFAIGKILKIDDVFDQVQVEFIDFNNLRMYFESIPRVKTYELSDVRRCKILNNSYVRLAGGLDGTVLCSNGKNTDDFYSYYVLVVKNGAKEIIKASEGELLVQLTRGNVNPMDQMIRFELQNPMWYKRRSIVSASMNVLKNATYGLDILVGSRTYLLSHQVDTIIRAISEEPCRLMLADEVGLGKTIEACVIMKGLKQKRGELRTLIIAPDSLCNQWKNELDLKFWTNVPVVREATKIAKLNDVILPLEDLETINGCLLLNMNWDLVIVDETHRLVGMDDTYDYILDLSLKTQNILLLSATPIQQRQTEYLKLLALLNPKRYANMKKPEFDKLYEKNKYVKDLIYELYRNLDKYIEFDLCEDYIDDLDDMARKLNDNIIKELLDLVDTESEDSGLSIVKVILAYISENYQIERNIIRHRRIELKQNLAQRRLEDISYYMKGSSESYFEADVYQLLINYISRLNENKNISNLVLGEYIKLLLSACFSSPWALKKILDYRITTIQINNFVEFDGKNISMLIAPRKEEQRKEIIIKTVTPFEGEEKRLEELYALCNLWCEACKEDIDNIQMFIDDPYQVRGRLLNVIDYIYENGDNKKYVIFTSWIETLIKMKSMLQKVFGEKSTVTFYSKMNEKALEKSVDDFQNDKNCRFIICDELGGEGRNFQIADEVIHLDIPWSPVSLEQRIGRLDRIGRNQSKEVVSVVLYSKDTVEQDLFNLWNKGLNIFSESLSGMEIALGDVQDNLIKCLCRDIQFGLSELLEKISLEATKMREEVNKERYYDMARQLDINTQRQLTQLIEKFDDKGGKLLADTMLSWSKQAGLGAEVLDDYNKQDNSLIVSFNPSRFNMASMSNVLYVAPKLDEARKRSKGIQNIVGTFSRDVAVTKENLIFFAPGEPFFESIIMNSDECDRGKCAGILIKGDYNWIGYVFKWNLRFDMKELIEKNIDIAYAAKAQGYIPLEQYPVCIPIKKEFETIDKGRVLETLENYNKNHAYNLGQRGREKGKNIVINSDISNAKFFKSKFSQKTWTSMLNNAYTAATKEVKSYINNSIDRKRVESDFDRIINGNKAANIYYGREGKIHIEENKKLVEIYDAVKNGIFRPDVELDSMSFIWVVKS